MYWKKLQTCAAGVCPKINLRYFCISQFINLGGTPWNLFWNDIYVKPFIALERRQFTVGQNEEKDKKHGSWVLLVIQESTKQLEKMAKGAVLVQKLYHASVTLRTLWPLATGNHGGLRPRIGGPTTSMMLWPLSTTNCGGLRPRNFILWFKNKREIVFGQPQKR